MDTLVWIEVTADTISIDGVKHSKGQTLRLRASVANKQVKRKNAKIVTAPKAAKKAKTS